MREISNRLIGESGPAQPVIDSTTDRVAHLATRLGLPPRDTCDSRQPLLNRADRWLSQSWTRITAVGNLAIVTPYFNPANYPKLVENFRAFLTLIGSVPLFPVEVSFGRPWISEGLQIRGGERNVLWQKERLINLGVAGLPAKYDRIAWFDSDIVLTDADWYQAIERALDKYPVVQVGDAIIVEGKQRKLAAAHAFAKWSKLGYAWAARREILPLYDAAVIGGGDMLCAYGWLGRQVSALTPGPQWLKHYEIWARKAHSQVKGQIGHIPGTLVHLDHGSQPDRQYNERYHLLAGLDPEVDLITDASGLWAWSDGPATTKFRAAMNAFFASRQDG